MKTVRVPQEIAETMISSLKELGNIVKSVLVDEQNFMYLIIHYVPA